MSSFKEADGLGEVQITDNSWNVAPGITRISFGFPNMYVVEGSRGSAIIDTGWGDEEEVDALKARLDETKRPLKAMIVTHKHPDHEGGIDELRQIYPDVPVVVGVHEEEFEGWKTIELGRRRLTVFGGPGHKAEHKYVFDSQERALFTGDNIMGDLSGGVLYMKKFMDGLGALVSLQPNILCPGHYESVYNATNAVQDVLRHRQEREQEVLNALSTKRSSSLDKLFDKIYGADYKSKREMAILQIESHLVKLLEEDKVRSTNAGWVRVTD